MVYIRTTLESHARSFLQGSCYRRNTVGSFFWYDHWFQKGSSISWFFVGPICLIIQFVCWSSNNAFSFCLSCKESLIGLCVSIRFQFNPKLSRNLSYIILLCSITAFALNECFTQLNVFRIRVSEFWKCINFRKFFLQYVSGGKFRGAKFWEGCGSQVVLLFRWFF